MVESGEGLSQIFLEQLIEYTVLALEIIITIIIIIIVGITLALLIKTMFSKLSSSNSKEKRTTPRICRSISKTYVKGTFDIARFLSRQYDLLKSILVPTLTELATLAMIVAIRIMLSWSLSKEIESQMIQKDVR